MEIVVPLENFIADLDFLTGTFSFAVHMGQFLNSVNTTRIPTFAGIKFTSTLIDEGLAAVNARNGRFAVFLGSGNVSIPYSKTFFVAAFSICSCNTGIEVPSLKL